MSFSLSTPRVESASYQEDGVPVGELPALTNLFRRLRKRSLKGYKQERNQKAKGRMKLRTWMISTDPTSQCEPGGSDCGAGSQARHQCPLGAGVSGVTTGEPTVPALLPESKFRASAMSRG